jgi:polar amino acid transport system substrate-binding protein
MLCSLHRWRLTSFSALAFQQPGKITAGSDMTFFLMNIWKTTSRPGLYRVSRRSGENHGPRGGEYGYPLSNLIPGLQGGRFDITNSSMYITAERLKVIDMVPYLKSGEAILALKGATISRRRRKSFAGTKSARWAPPRGWRSCKSSPPTTA